MMELILINVRKDPAVLESLAGARNREKNSISAEDALDPNNGGKPWQVKLIDMHS